MAVIKPFKGYRPPADLTALVTSPPYDVMTSDEARGMIKNNSDSFLRIIKPEIDFDSSHAPRGEALHKHGAENLQAFINEGKLIQDGKPSFYIYQITMGSHTQTGIMAAVSVQEYNDGLIKKHEFTRPEKENDRTRHIDITNANTGPVFLTFRNDGNFQTEIKSILQAEADISFNTENDTIHTLWKVEDEENITGLAEYFRAIPELYIADGHHRAASAARVQKNRIDANPNPNGNEPYNFFLSVIFPDDEMQILDYNRVVKDLNGLTEEKFLELLKPNFTLIPASSLLPPATANIYSMYLNGKWYNLKANSHIRSDDPVEGLEASILQKYLLTPTLDIDDPRTNDRIDFVGGIRGMEELERRCQTDCAVAFALPPITIEQLLSVADSGQAMPPKTTWFEPKLRSGLVVRLLD